MNWPFQRVAIGAVSSAPHTRGTLACSDRASCFAGFSASGTSGPSVAIAVATVRDFLAEDDSIDKVVFSVFGAEAEAAYRKELGR
ncbi:MAG: hypothetical protein Tsb0032_39410 [Kiloniellaceae bacterium]